MASLTESASSGDRRGTLIALRDCIANQIETCESGRDMASLSKRLMEVMDEIDKLPDPNAAKSATDEMREKYAKG